MHSSAQQPPRAFDDRGAPGCAILTPAGRAAIATVGVFGNGAIEIVARRFSAAVGKPLTACRAGRVAFGRFATSGIAAEELVVGVLAPDELELHCHGGSLAASAVCGALVREGCELVGASVWAHRQGKSQIAAEALAALGHARTERTALALLDQYRGALEHALARIDQDLASNEIAAGAAAIGALLERAELGRHVTQPWRIAIAGPPNAGKSSLLNALLGFGRAIVFPHPGTTRDILSATTAFAGWPVELTDMAGLRTAHDPLETEGIARARRTIAAADAVIFVADGTLPWNSLLYGEVRDLLCPGRPLLVAYNKCDLSEDVCDRRPPGTSISAKTGQGLDALGRQISVSLVPRPLVPGEAIPFTPRQCDALARAAALLACDDVLQAREQLDGLRH